jgi:hypothetical protein
MSTLSVRQFQPAPSGEPSPAGTAIPAQSWSRTRGCELDHNEPVPCGTAEGTEPRRTVDGDIDYSYYIKRAHRLRCESFRDVFRWIALRAGG